MRILVVNPNSSQAATDIIAAEAALAAGSRTHIVAMTAPRGPANIDSMAESAAQAPVVLEMLKSEAGDGAIIGAYSDPGLELVRAHLTLPVVGIGEASMREASRFGTRIVIISSNPNNEPLYKQCAAKLGISEKIAAIRYIPKEGRSTLDVVADRAGLISSVARLSRSAIADDGADVIIIAGGPLAGVARDVKQQLDFPVLDPVACAVKRIERWVNTGNPEL
jgi:Asp/Glu/hydantoin racemase